MKQSIHERLFVKSASMLVVALLATPALASVEVVCQLKTKEFISEGYEDYVSGSLVVKKNLEHEVGRYTLSVDVMGEALYVYLQEKNGDYADATVRVPDAKGFIVKLTLGNAGNASVTCVKQEET